MPKKVLAARSPATFSRHPSLPIAHLQQHAPLIPTVLTTPTPAAVTTTAPEETSTTSTVGPMLSAMSAETRVTTPENAPILGGLFHAPMPRHQTQVQAVLGMARMLPPVEMLLWPRAVSTTSMLKKLRMHQMLCWVRSLLTQYLQLFCLILVPLIHLLRKNLLLREV